MVRLFVSTVPQLFIHQICFHPAPMILDDVLMIQARQDLDLIQKFMNRVNQVSFALRRLKFDDFKCVEMLVEFGLDFMHSGEPT